MIKTDFSCFQRNFKTSFSVSTLTARTKVTDTEYSLLKRQDLGKDRLKSWASVSFTYILITISKFDLKIILFSQTIVPVFKFDPSRKKISRMTNLTGVLKNNGHWPQFRRLWSSWKLKRPKRRWRKKVTGGVSLFCLHSPFFATEFAAFVLFNVSWISMKGSVKSLLQASYIFSTIFELFILSCFDFYAVWMVINF